MVELILSWVLLFFGLAYREPLYFIASGIFAVAMHIDSLKGKVNK